MFGGLNRPLAAAVVVGAAITAALAGPSTALACSSSTSAVSVYTECPQNGGGGAAKSTGHESGSKPPSVSAPAAKALSQAGKDAKELRQLVNSNDARHLAGAPSGSTTTPSAVGSAFDLGSGPTALFIALVGTAALILGGSGFRVWRNRHRAQL